LDTSEYRRIVAVSRVMRHRRVPVIRRSLQFTEGATCSVRLPAMAAELSCGETVLTGALEDQAAVYGVVAQLEALGLELIELRRSGESPGSGECTSPG
jgi:hypothetical protein